MNAARGWHRWFVALALAFMLLVPAALLAKGYYYKVQQNDTLTLIARRHDISTAELARANRVRYDATLVPGTRLWVPAEAPKQKAPARSRHISSFRQKTSASSQRIASAEAARRAQASRSSTASRHRDTYTVRKGDTLWKISRQHGLSVEELAALNGIDKSSTLRVGQTLRVKKERFEDVPGGGIRRASASPSQPSTSSAGYSRPSSRGYIWPVRGKLVRRFVRSSDERYTGIDIETAEGTEVRAVRSGKVVYAGGVIPSYGRMVILEHDGGLASCYGQLSRSLVREGQQVRRGQIIARSGATSRGEALLHFEIRRNGEAVDPEPYLP